MSDPAEPMPHFAVPYLRTARDGKPALWGVRCGACGENYLGARMACPRCCTRGSMMETDFTMHGRLYTYSAVYRSYPGVRTPFIMAIVDLENGPTVRGTLVDVPTDAVGEDNLLHFGMPVKVIVRATDQLAPDGNPYHVFYFTPALNADSHPASDKDDHHE